MIVIDSSVWIDYFKEEDSPGGLKLNRLLLIKADIAILPIILTEVLMGFKDDKSFSQARSVIQKVPLLTPRIDTYVQAAALFRHLRKHGLTIRGSIDCIIAQSCIESEALLATLDKDFKAIAKHSRLQLFQ